MVLQIAVIDDQSSQREGRVSWLRDVPDCVATGLTFEQAMAADWQAVDIAILDGHDRRSINRRAEAAAAAGIEPIAPYDNFVGVRVAERIRQTRSPEQTRIILVSAHARDSGLRARRIAQAGVDFVFEHYEVDADQETFVRAVLHPESFSPHPDTFDWQALGYSGEPDVAAAIKTWEASAAGPMLLDDERHRDNPQSEWALRTLRSGLHAALPGSMSDGSGPRRKRAPAKAWLSKQIRQAFGRDLPTDPD
jgi:CheY-like chemotaxis protein